MNLIGRAITFENTIAEWFGEGAKPDPNSQSRANVCTGRITGRPCPFNYQGKWIVEDRIADAVKRMVEAKNHLKLKVEGEERLGHCEICSCVLSLKVHVPMKHILNHTSAQKLAEFKAKMPGCWFNTEATEQPK